MAKDTGLLRLNGNALKPALRLWQGISPVDWRLPATRDASRHSA
jgi:hypothetical protein